MDVNFDGSETINAFSKMTWWRFIILLIFILLLTFIWRLPDILKALF